jgi:uroporphyrinogen-III decarboxylase
MDDYGYHGRTFLPLDRWNACIYPYLSRMIAAAHEEGALAMLHSCGYQGPFLPAYAAAGLDLLHPLQGDAGNDFAAEYNTYTGKISFVTGIDIARAETSHPDDIQQDIMRHLFIAQRGGFILAPTSEITHTIPLDNMKAILEAIARTAG